MTGNCRRVEAEHKVLVLKHLCAIPSPKHSSTEGTCSVLEPFPEEERSLVLPLISEDPQFFPLFILSLKTNKQTKVFERQLKLSPHQRQEICSSSLTVGQAVLLCKEQCIKTGERERKGVKKKEKRRIYVSLAMVF